MSLGSEIICDMRPLSWQKLKEKTCINCYREFMKAMCLAASVYENYRAEPEELLEDHPELADCMVTKYSTLRKIVKDVTKVSKKLEENENYENLWRLWCLICCFDYWLVKFAFGFCEMNNEKAPWEDE